MNINDHFKNYRDKPCDRYLIEVLKESQFLIFGVVFKIVSHKQDAEDLTQEVLIKVIQNINVLPNNTNFIGWLSKVSLNTAINHYQQKKRTKTLLTGYQEIQNNQNFENEEEKLAIIYQHLAKLEDIEQSMVINKHVNQMTISQLGKLYQLPDSTIELKIKKIVNKLKNSIEKAGFASVALGLSSTFDQMKAAKFSIDLIPKIKEQLPTTYPKAKLISTKVLMGILVVVTTIALFLGIENLTDSKSPKNLDSVNSTLTDNRSKTPIQEKKKNTTPEKFHKTLTEVSKINEELPIKSNLKIEPEANPNTIKNKENSISTEYAGQLLDAITKAPIADAKLEIWDIYTYDKIESKTDEEGKYTIPKNLDTTFFYYLKFIKEGFISKQTFQHFEIHKNILIYMNSGKKVECNLSFNQPTSGEIYLGSQINLKEEQYLSANQKLVLTEVFNSVLENGPVEFYTLKKIKLDNVTEYALKEMLLESLDFPPINFGIWYEGKLKKGQFGIYKNNLGALFIEGPNPSPFKYESAPTRGILKLGNQKPYLYELGLKQSGKPILNKELSVINKKTRNESILRIANSNIIEEPEFDLINGILTLEGNYFYAKYEESQFSSPKNQLVKIWLTPYTSINFEPLSLESKFNDTQAVGCGRFFSKKSVFKKVKDNFGYIRVYDKFFEDIFLNTSISTSIGGTIDINSGFNITEYRKIKISILVNDKPLKEKTLYVHLLDDEENSEFRKPNIININTNGFGDSLIPLKTKIISFNFSANGIIYSKKIDLNQMVDDNIIINFNQKLTIELSQEAKDSYAFAQHKYNECFESVSMRLFEGVCLKNDDTSITIPFYQNSVFSVFVEKEAEYTISDGGYGLKTIYNTLKALEPIVIKSNIEKVELKLESKLNYSSFRLEIYDETGNEINTNHWLVVQENYDESLKRMKTLFPNEDASKPVEFFNKTQEAFKGKNQLLVDDIIFGEEAINKKSLHILNNRSYVLRVSVEGYINYFEKFSIENGGNIFKKVILHKANTIIIKGDTNKEFDKIFKILKQGDIIYQYNGQRVFNKDSFIKAQSECELEMVTIKLIRNNIQMSFMIPSFKIIGIEDYYFEDKNGVLEEKK